MKLIIFDQGGVITVKNGNHKRLIDTLGKKYKISGENFMKNYFIHFKKYHFDRTLSQYNFWKKTLGEIKENVTEKEINSTIDLFNKLKPELNKEMFRLIKKLSQKYKLVLLSHTSRENDVGVFTSKYIRYFDKICLSSMNSRKKQRKEAFTDILKSFNIKPEETFFIDDKEKNLMAPKQLGIKTHLFIDYQELKKELKKLKII